ncbi:MAG TPA: hypothetical protein VMW39_06625, partial [bacterium]|nr:hypothetical protein [bacterium]
LALRKLHQNYVEVMKDAGPEGILGGFSACETLEGYNGQAGIRELAQNPDSQNSAKASTWQSTLTPHAIFLAMMIDPDSAKESLSRLQQKYPGLYNPSHGWYDGLDLKTEGIVRRLLTLNQGMSLIAQARLAGAGLDTFLRNHPELGPKIKAIIEKKDRTLEQKFATREKPSAEPQEVSVDLSLTDFESGRSPTGPTDPVSDMGAFYDPPGYTRESLVEDPEKGTCWRLESYVPQGKYNGTWMKLRNLDLSNYKSFVFDVRGDKRQGYTTTFKIELKNSRGEVGTYVVSGVTDKWQRKPIPLSEFEGITDWKDITEFTIVFEEGRATKQKGVIYIDNIFFSKGTKPSASLTTLTRRVALPAGASVEVIASGDFFSVRVGDIITSVATGTKREILSIDKQTGVVQVRRTGISGKTAIREMDIKEILRAIQEGDAKIESVTRPMEVTQGKIPDSTNIDEEVIRHNERMLDSEKFCNVLLGEPIGGNAGINRAGVNVAVDKDGRIVAIIKDFLHLDPHIRTELDKKGGKYENVCFSVLMLNTPYSGAIEIYRTAGLGQLSEVAVENITKAVIAHNASIVSSKKPPFINVGDTIISIVTGTRRKILEHLPGTIKVIGDREIYGSTKVLVKRIDIDGNSTNESIPIETILGSIREGIAIIERGSSSHPGSQFEGAPGWSRTDLKELGAPADIVIGALESGKLILTVSVENGRVIIKDTAVNINGTEIRIRIDNAQKGFARCSDDGKNVFINLDKVNRLLKDSNLTGEEKIAATERILIHDIAEGYALQQGFNPAEGHTAGMMAEAMHPANSQRIHDALAQVLAERDRRQAKKGLVRIPYEGSLGVALNRLVARRRIEKVTGAKRIIAGLRRDIDLYVDKLEGLLTLGLPLVAGYLYYRSTLKRRVASLKKKGFSNKEITPSLIRLQGYVEVPEGSPKYQNAQKALASLQEKNPTLYEKLTSRKGESEQRPVIFGIGESKVEGEAEDTVPETFETVEAIGELEPVPSSSFAFMPLLFLRGFFDWCSQISHNIIEEGTEQISSIASHLPSGGLPLGTDLHPKLEIVEKLSNLSPYYYYIIPIEIFGIAVVIGLIVYFGFMRKSNVVEFEGARINFKGLAKRVKTIRIGGEEDKKLIVINKANDRVLKITPVEEIEAGQVEKQIRTEEVNALKIGSYPYKITDGKVIDLSAEWLGNTELLDWAGLRPKEMAKRAYEIRAGPSKRKYTYNLIKDQPARVLKSPLCSTPASKPQLEEARLYLEKNDYNSLESPHEKQLYFHYLYVITRGAVSEKFDSDDAYNDIISYRVLATNKLREAVKYAKDEQEKEIINDIVWSMGLFMVRADGPPGKETELTAVDYERISQNKPFNISKKGDFERLAEVFDEIIKRGKIRPYFLVNIKNFSPDNYLAYLEALDDISERYNGMVTFIVSIEMPGTLTGSLPGSLTAMRRTADLLGKE